MAEVPNIDRQKVTNAFDEFAKRHGDENAVLDVSTLPEAKHKNVYRNYFSKRLSLKYLKPNRNDVIIDFGCGVGRLSRFLAPHVKKIEGLDKSSEMIRVAKETTPANSNINYTNITGSTFPLSDNSATKFFSFWVLQHVDDEELVSILKEAKRVVQSGGSIILFEQVKSKSTVFAGIHHMRTPQEYIEAGKRAGLTFVSDDPVFRFPSYGMTIWQKLPWLPKMLFPVLAGVDDFTVNRKPETIVYSTNAITFKA